MKPSCVPLAWHANRRNMDTMMDAFTHPFNAWASGRPAPSVPVPFPVADLDVIFDGVLEWPSSSTRLPQRFSVEIVCKQPGLDGAPVVNAIGIDEGSATMVRAAFPSDRSIAVNRLRSTRKTDLLAAGQPAVEAEAPPFPIRRTDSGAGVNVPPLASIIWSLVERQQLRAARKLVELLPDEPQHRQLKNLLRPPTTSTVDRRDIDRSAEYAWLRTQGHKYAGLWVAIAGDSLLAAAKTLKELRREIQDAAPTSKPLLHHIE